MRDRCHPPTGGSWCRHAGARKGAAWNRIGHSQPSTSGEPQRLSLTNESIEAVMGLPLGTWLELVSPAWKSYSQTKVGTMNRYGARAMEMWQRSAPWAYQDLVDAGETERFFEDLGEEIAARIDQLSQTLAAKLPPGLDEKTRFSEVLSVNRQAEEIVMTELVYDPVGQMSRDELHQEIGDLMGDLPGIDSLIEARFDLMSTAQDRLEVEWENSSTPRPPMYFPSTAPANTPLSQMWYTPEHGWNPAVKSALLEHEVQDLAEIDRLEEIVRAYESDSLTPDQTEQVRKYVAELRTQGLA